MESPGTTCQPLRISSNTVACRPMVNVHRDDYVEYYPSADANQRQRIQPNQGWVQQVDMKRKAASVHRMQQDEWQNQMENLIVPSAPSCKYNTYEPSRYRPRMPTPQVFHEQAF
jgi:hypothetical protein